MKRALILFVCLILTFSLIACDEGKSGENGGKSVKVGDTLKAPEKIAELDDFEKLTVYVDFDAKALGIKRTEINSYYKNGDTAIYYYGMNDTGTEFSMSYVTTVKDGKSTSYYEGWSDFEPIDEISEGQTNEEFHITNLAFLGINPENDKTIVEYVKEKDDTFDGKDCYVYTVKYEETDSEEEFSDTTVWIDKETGLWLKSSFTIDGAEVTRVITGVEESAVVIPGTLPANIEETDVYNTMQFRLTAKKLDTTNPNFAGVITFEAENKSDKNIRVYTNSFDINGLALAQKAFDETVPAGTTVEFECNIPDSSAELANIEIIKDITMNLHLEADGVVIEDIEAERIKTDAPILFVQEVDKMGIEILNENGVRVVFQSFEFVNGRPMFKAWIENNFTEPVRVTINLNKINGEEYDDFEKLYMPSNSEGYSAFYLSDEEITELESIEITAEAFSGALLSSDRVTEETETITIELK
ncbi:MAG: hypothetical protein IIV81_01870 [Clostridia bacterium]|nr:hypothetical protein [Clostridia bacterium]